MTEPRHPAEAPPAVTAGWRHRILLGLLLVLAFAVWTIFALAFLPSIAQRLQPVLCMVAGDCTLPGGEASVPDGTSRVALVTRGERRTERRNWCPGKDSNLHNLAVTGT